MKDTAFSVFKSDDHRLVTVCTFFLATGVGCCQHMKVLSGSSKAFVKFILRVYPFCWHSFRNGMRTVANNDCKDLLLSMRSSRTFCCVADQLPRIIIIYIRTILLIAVSPSAQRDHLIK